MKAKNLIIITATMFALTAAGCGEAQKAAEVTPTPAAPTATPIPSPTATPTPAPTATPAPRLIGVKTPEAKAVALTNNTNKVLREFHIMDSQTGEWGRNLIPAESSIKEKEQVQMYYTPVSSGSGSEESSAEPVGYNLKVVDKDGNTYEMYGVELEDMERAALKFQDDTVYLSYMSVREKKEKDTRESSVSSSAEDDYQYDYDYDYDYDYEDPYEEDPYDYDGSGDDGSDDGNDYSDDPYDGSGDDGSGDDGTADDGTADDGTADDGSGDDGYGDDGTSYDDSDYYNDDDIIWDANGQME